MDRNLVCIKCKTEMLGLFNSDIESGIWVKNENATLLKSKKLVTDAYVCPECGYIEKYLNNEDLERLHKYRHLSQHY